MNHSNSLSLRGRGWASDSAASPSSSMQTLGRAQASTQALESPPDQFLGRGYALGCAMRPLLSLELWKEVKTGYQGLPLPQALKGEMFL